MLGTHYMYTCLTTALDISSLCLYSDVCMTCRCVVHIALCWPCCVVLCEKHFLFCRILNPTYPNPVPATFPIQVDENARTVTVAAGIPQRILLDYLANYKWVYTLLLNQEVVLHHSFCLKIYSTVHQVLCCTALDELFTSVRKTTYKHT